MKHSSGHYQLLRVELEDFHPHNLCRGCIMRLTRCVAEETFYVPQDEELNFKPGRLRRDKVGIDVRSTLRN